jgi:PAS domain S-box-containing protein
MSVVTTQPEVFKSAPATSNEYGHAGGSQDCSPGSAGIAGSGGAERRRLSGASAMDVLTQLPALVALERIPVPTLAMARDGIILFANTAFAEMVGYQPDSLAGLGFPKIFDTVPASVTAFTDVDTLANLIVQLRHREGWTVQARMSKSALMRRDDSVVLVTFANLTERLWTDERCVAWA